MRGERLSSVFLQSKYCVSMPLYSQEAPSFRHASPPTLADSTCPFKTVYLHSSFPSRSEYRSNEIKRCQMRRLFSARSASFGSSKHPSPSRPGTMGLFSRKHTASSTSSASSPAHDREKRADDGKSKTGLGKVGLIFGAFLHLSLPFPLKFRRDRDIADEYMHVLG
jgi:hypothetical protein